jgi:signal transduction histidine kinase/ActR/RegA family two-component response regulator
LKWWLALTLAGPGWTIFGVIKLFAGSFLAFFALQHGVEAALADDPAHMYLVAFSYVSHNPDLALVLAGVFVIISQLKINVTNAYAGSLAWSNFFSRITHNHPGRIVWLFFNVAIALLLMELGLYQAFETILITYSSLVLAWMGALVADLAVNRPLGLRPREIEFKRGYLYDINPVGVGSMILASLAGVSGQLGLFGVTAQALAPFIALFLPFVTAPLIAWRTGGRYYRARPSEPAVEAVPRCLICDNVFEVEDTCHCTAYDGRICSLCCALDASCGDHCRPDAHLQAQTGALLGRLLPASAIDRLHSSVGRFLWMLGITAILIAGLFGLVYLSAEASMAAKVAEGVGEALFQTYFLLMIVTGVLIWLYVLAGESREKALAESRERSASLGREVAAHDKTYRQLQETKEAAVAANRAKSRYLSGVSHELRTPLNTILGYAQLLEDDPNLPASNRRAAVSIRRGGEHLADVIEGLLEISKIEARRVDLHRDQVNLPALLEQLTEMFAAQARARNLAFRYQCENNLPQYVNTDEKRLRQVLINLLSNAVKFTREGEVSLRVSYRNQVARFVVADTGVGIRPEDQETIFNPFERVRDEATQSVSGTGLGLTISRLLCSMLGGDLALASEYGQGSTFTLSLMLPVEHNPRSQPLERQRIAGYLGPRRKVLVVDDEPGHRALVADYLGPLGFEVREAHNGELALQLAAEQLPDIALLDVHMPLMDGWTLAGRLRETGFAGPVIMVSGNAIEDHRRELAGRLHSDYMIKPVRLAELLEKIGAALGLEWSDQPPVPAKTPSPTKAGEGVPPDPDDLEELKKMAGIGYLDGVQRKLDAMEQAGVDPALITALREKAEMCDFQGLIGLL